MKQIIQRLTNYEILSVKEAYDSLIALSKGDVNETQMAAFMTVYMMRSISVQELTGFRNALLDLCLKVDLKQDQVIDMCGTGGDGKDTFNISTLSAFVVAGAGAKVGKHGNYGVSSSCGSSNVMEALGYRFTNDAASLQKQIGQAGICIMHAPLFHPAMKSVAPVRKGLGMKTFFNMLGPLVNPSFPTHQSVGVFNLEIARLYHYLLQNTDKTYQIVYALDGYDEISLTGDFKLISQKEEVQLSPKDIGLQKLQAEAISGGDSIQSAKDIFLKVLNNQGTSAQNEVVYANAGVALSTYFNVSFEEGVAMAKESLQSGKALQSLEKAIQISNESI